MTVGGVTGTSVTPGTKVQIIIQNKPDSLIQDLPTGGVVIGSTNTVEGGWEFPWDKRVPGYTLLDGQEYILKYMLPNGQSYDDTLIYKCKEAESDLENFVSEYTLESISGEGSNTVLSCSAPDNSLKFSGSTNGAYGTASPGTISTN